MKKIWFFSVLLAFSFSVFSTEKHREFLISQSVKPCDDFYEYACSEVSKTFKLPAGKEEYIFSFHDAAEKIGKVKEKFIKQKHHDSEMGKAIGMVYQSCLDQESQKKQAQVKIQEVISKVRNHQTKEAFLNMLSKNILESQLNLINFTASPNPENPTKNDVVFFPDIEPVFDRDKIKDKVLIQSYTKLLTQFFRKLNVSNPEQRAAKIMRFEIEFAEVAPNSAEQREMQTDYQYISRNELLKSYPNFKLDDLLKRIPAHVKVRHLAPKAMKFFNDSMNDLLLLKSIYLFESLSGRVGLLHPDFEVASDAFFDQLRGYKGKDQTTEQECIELVGSLFNKELDFLLLPKVLPNFSQKKFEIMAEKVRTSLISLLEENPYLDDQSKLGAIKKVRLAKLTLVKPNKEKDWDFNPKLTFHENQYSENIAKLKLAKHKRNFDQLGNPNDLDVWSDSVNPLDVNAFYNPLSNQFILLGGILQYPFYDQSLHEDINLGGIGVIIGHELGHAIDDSGSQYDEKGRFVQWMSDESKNEFQKRSNVLVEQFNAIGHDGKLTLGENIADWVGLTVAFDAAFPHKDSANQQVKKAFYLQYARTYCGVLEKNAIPMILKTDPHALGKARINEQVVHQKGFIEAYQCKPGDKMYKAPKDRVKIW